MEQEDDDVSALTAPAAGQEGEQVTDYQLPEEETKKEQSNEKGDKEEKGGEDGERFLDQDSDEDSEEGIGKMVVDGFECPDDLLMSILPMEFEEMVNLFRTYDANGSGTIDKHEARKILQSMGMDASLEKAEELLKIVDVDGSGEIDFDEFCHWIALIKDGDERFAAFGEMMNKVHNTPLGDLEHQAGARGFKLQFETREIRPATATQPQMFVVELVMTGTFFDRDKETGQIVSEHCSRRYQGIGVSNREAKYAACKVATIKLRQMMPGTKYEEGFFPDDWVEWTDENLLRGVDPKRVASILAAKGFHPYANPNLMERLCVWVALDEFLDNNPDFDIRDNTLNPNFRRWVDTQVGKGMDGSNIVKVLEDRNIDLKGEQILYWQKLRNNELGTILGKNGTDIKQFSFFTACDCGMFDEVLMFCNAAQPLDVEQFFPRTGSFERALFLAAGGGHDKSVRALLDFGADVHALDTHGRSALHRAAMNGHVGACKVLVENGANLFDGDFQGNTALHFGAVSNNKELVDYLAWQGQEFTRTMCSDKIRVKAGCTFNDLVEVAFRGIISLKLKESDVLRFEKAWLHDACVLFKTLMDKNVRRFMPNTCDPIMHDVLARFDPRPETGVYVSAAAGTEMQDFIPTIPSPVELAVLMRFMFRQAAVDSINSLKRTALHSTCDANKIDSHEPVIRQLIDIYGCNTQLRDMHGRRPIELLMLDRDFQGRPSATLVREEFLLVERQRRLEEMSAAFDAEEKRKNNLRRLAILEDCSWRSADMGADVWAVVLEACGKKRNFGNWELWEDPESLNQFYTHKTTVPLDDGSLYDVYTWDLPAVVRSRVHRTWAIMYQFFVRSTKLRKFGNWTQYRCNQLRIDVYYDEEADRVRYMTPKEAAWSIALKDSVVVQRMGFSNEYDELRDTAGNIFYRNNMNDELSWDPPADAVKSTPADEMCTAARYKKKDMMQRLFTCEECNRAWKASAEGAKVMLRMCEPCIVRCHKGHKGVRQLADMSVSCLCEAVGRVKGAFCCATSVGPRQARLSSEAQDLRIENQRRREHNALMPPIFANVPDKHPNGQPKRLSGWLLCRRPPLKGAENMGEVDEEDEDDNTTKTEGSFSTQSGSLNRYEPLPESVTEKLLTSENYPYVAPEGLPPGWIEVLDPEEPDELPRGTRVLIDMREKGPGLPFVYGNIVTKITKRKDVYLVRADLNGGTTMKVARSRIETIGRQIFYTHPETGDSAWFIEEAAAGEVFHSKPMQLPHKEWLEVYRRSTMKRAFGHKGTEEMLHVRTQMVYFVDAQQLAREKAANKIQTFARNRLRLQFPPQTMPFLWGSQAFTQTVCDEVAKEMKIRGAWAYMRRRAVSKGDFLDVEGNEWDEYVDNETSEYFYWCEDDNLYQWDKPPLPQKTKVVVDYLKIGEEVYFRFPGKRTDDVCVITRMRFDDQDGGDMYDLVHKYDAKYTARWVSRLRIKKLPTGGDMLAQLREERGWRNILARQRDAEERRKKRDMEKKLAEDLQRLEDIRTGKMLMGGKVSDQARMIMGRAKRAEMESEVIKREIDQREGVARRDRMRDIVAQIKADNLAQGIRLSRADMLALERTTMVKLVMEERIEKRNALRFELLARKRAVEQRGIDAESALREAETKMTTPRSIIRRRVMRRVHFAMKRQDDNYLVCEWGCQDWVRNGFDMIDHQLKRCSKRILGCQLLCTLKMSEEDWMKPQFTLTQEELDELALREIKRQDEGISVESDHADLLKDKVSRQQYHETEECIKRLVVCPRQCLEWVVFEKLQHHLDELCTKRPAEPIFCRLGCGAVFGGEVDKMIESEDERMEHETEQCDLRMVRCNWQFPDGNMCAAQMRACDRQEHRDYHLLLVGVTTYTVAGTHLYKVPKRINKLKIQLWGAGGGSGYFLSRQGGNGGGGAFVEAIIDVEPYDVLEIVLGTGGCGGAGGSEIEPAGVDEQRAAMKVRRTAEMFLSRDERLDPNRKVEMADFSASAAACGITLGGVPGGGEGYGGGGCWACGGGGGYSIVAKRTPRGNQAFLVAAGGGGGGSLHGLPGGNMEGHFVGELIDPVCGGQASAERGGIAGDSGALVNSQWAAEAGKMWQGGNACEFGGGGGGGYYGGGGGGTRPGLAGGGGGGASYVYAPVAYDYVIVAGHGRMPGGLQHDPPAASGCGEWDKVGGLAGEGGQGDTHKTHPGNAGACRILKPGYY